MKRGSLGNQCIDLVSTLQRFGLVDNMHNFDALYCNLFNYWAIKYGFVNAETVYAVEYIDEL